MTDSYFVFFLNRKRFVLFGMIKKLCLNILVFLEVTNPDRALHFVCVNMKKDKIPFIKFLNWLKIFNFLLLC